MSSVTKLSTHNYLMWRRQVRALLEGHELHHFIEDSAVIPSPTVTTDGVTSPNPAFAPWKRQDRLLYSAMIGAITLSVQSVVSMATTTKEVWDTLEETFGKPTRGHIRQLKMQIRSCVKGSQTISEYLRTLKSKADDLALLGNPMDKEDFVEQVLMGLGEEFKPEIDAINGRDNPISFSELHERLLNREAMILCAATPSPGPIVANVTDVKQRSHPRGNNGSTYSRGNNYNHNSGQNRSHNPGYNHNARGGQSRGGYQGKCQACGVHGHSAKFCSQFRLVRGSGDHSSWTPSAPPSWSNHSAPQSWPRANAAHLSDASTWLLDSGASHHMTSDLSNLASHHPYNGGEDVLLGDGSALPITHSGSASFPSYSHPFFIDDILCVPSLDKNLISVFQLCKTNQVAVTFTPTYFQVKDLLTGELRLQGKPANGTMNGQNLRLDLL